MLKRYSEIYKEGKFKIIIILSVISGYFNMVDIGKNISFENAITNSFNGIMYPLFLFFILVMTASFTITNYNKNYQSLIRFNNKKEYLEDLLSTIFKNLLFVYIVYSIICLSFIITKYFGRYEFETSIYSGIPNFIYNIFLYIKVFLIYELIIKIGVLIYKGTSKTIGVLFLLLMYILKSSWIYNINIVDSFRKIPLFFGYYLITISYSSLFLELFSFVLQVTILVIIIELIKHFVLKYKEITIED